MAEQGRSMKQMTAKQYLAKKNPKIVVEVQWSKEDKCFIARSNLQGCSTHGDTVKEALEMAGDAVSLWIECVNED